MAQFATADDLADRLAVTLTGPEQTRAGKLLTLASGLIQKEARQKVERIAGDTLTRRGSYSSRVRLPERPVESITSVTLDGTALVEDDDYYRDGDELVRSVGWGNPSDELVVVYTHGYTAIPDAVKAICVEMVVRVWVNPGAARQEAIGSENVSYGAVGLLLTSDEKSVIRDALRRTSGSVTLR